MQIVKIINKNIFAKKKLKKEYLIRNTKESREKIFKFESIFVPAKIYKNLPAEAYEEYENFINGKTNEYLDEEKEILIQVFTEEELLQKIEEEKNKKITNLKKLLEKNEVKE